MSGHRVVVITLALLSGCGTKREPAPPAPVAPDAGPTIASGITELPVFDPDAGVHLDDADDREASVPLVRPRNRSARSLGIILRSTPSGAVAAVDGQPIGPTPTYWEGEFTGGEREFTFTLAHHAVARYRFVPTTDGVVHGRLEPIAVGDGDVAPAISTPVPTLPAGDPPAKSPVGAAPPTSTAPSPAQGDLAPPSAVRDAAGLDAGISDASAER
jgi:hypothetical protein